MNGTIISMWEGQTGKYFALYQYWIGVGYQYVERESTKEAYELWNL